MADFDPKSLDHWDAVDDVCPRTIEVFSQEFRCENEAGHEPPCSVTLYWAESSQEAEQ